MYWPYAGCITTNFLDYIVYICVCRVYFVSIVNSFCVMYSFLHLLYCGILSTFHMWFCLVGFFLLGFCHVGFCSDTGLTSFLMISLDRLLDLSLFSPGPGWWPHLYKLILCNGCLPALMFLHVLPRLCMSVWVCLCMTYHMRPPIVTMESWTWILDCSLFIVSHGTQTRNVLTFV